MSNKQTPQQQEAAPQQQMGTRVISVKLIEIPPYARNNKELDQSPHVEVVEEITYPQLNGKTPLVRTRGISVEQARAEGIPIPGEGA